MRIDAHVHVWPRGVAAEHDGSIEAATATLVGAGVDAAVLVQPALLGLDHSYLERAASGRLPAVGVAQAEPGDDERSLACLGELLGRDAFSGFRLPVLRGGVGWLRAWWPAYAELAAVHSSVVCFLAGPDQLAAIGEAAESAPSIALVVDHLGRPDLASDPDAAIAGICALAARPNIHVKVSALPVVGGGWSSAFLADAIRATVDAFGPDRVIWGSDHPFTERLGSYCDWPDAVCAALADYELAVRDRVLADNARRLFFPEAAP